MPTRIKRYEAELSELDALLARIEQEMGPDAQLETREFSRGGVLGVGGVKMVEIIATLEYTDPPAQSSRRSSPRTALSEANGKAAHNGAREEARQASRSSRAGLDLRSSPAPDDDLQTALPSSLPRQSSINAYTAASKDELPAPAPVSKEPDNSPAPTAPAPPARREPGRLSEADLLRIDLKQMQKSMDELRGTLAQMVDSQQKTQALAAEAVRTASEAAKRSAEPQNSAAGPAPRVGSLEQRVMERLQEWNIAPEDARLLVQAAQAQLESSRQKATNEADLLTAVSREICRGILLAEGINAPVREEGRDAYLVALVGPTGVGKTTTIAKLAAQFAFQAGRRVSLASLDNYRIAAAEQLRTYAEIIGLPLEIVFSAEEFRRVIEAQRSAELMLVDTAGRSPLNDKQIKDLAAIFDERRPDEVHLVISATTKADDLAGILEGFAPLKYNRIIISKLDETRSLGCLYNINKLAQVPISYFAVGQSVPEDLRPAQLSFIQSWIEQGRIT